MQLDFMEMLRLRDEKRRVRQVEAIRRQKELEDEGAAGAVRGDGGRKGGDEGGPRVEAMEDQGDVFSPPKVAPKPRTPRTTALFEESSSTSSSNPVASDRPVSQHHFPTLTSTCNLSAKIKAVR